MALRGLAGLGQLVDTTPAADDALDVAGRAGSAHGEQPLLSLGRGHAGQCPHLRVGELAAGERLGQPGQRAERARHTDPLAGGAQVHSDAPGQPVGAGAETGVPAAARVELTDEVEQPRGGSLQMRGQLGDLVAQSIHFSDGLRSDFGVECADLHDAIPLDSGATLHPGF